MGLNPGVEALKSGVPDSAILLFFTLILTESFTFSILFYYYCHYH